MKKLLLAGFVSATMIAPAFAGDVEAQCTAYVEENGGDASGCSCLAESVAGNEALEAEVAAIDSEEALEAASDEVKGVLGACFPKAE